MGIQKRLRLSQAIFVYLGFRLSPKVEIRIISTNFEVSPIRHSCPQNPLSPILLFLLYFRENHHKEPAQTSHPPINFKTAEQPQDSILAMDKYWIEEAQRHGTCSLGQEKCKDMCLDCPRARIAEQIAQLLVRDNDYGLNLLHLAAYRSEGGDISRLILKAKRNLQHTETSMRQNERLDQAN